MFVCGGSENVAVACAPVALVAKFVVLVPLVIVITGVVVVVGSELKVPIVFAPAAFVFSVSVLAPFTTVMAVVDVGGPENVPIADAVVGSLCVIVAALIDMVAPPPIATAFEETVPMS